MSNFFKSKNSHIRKRMRLISLPCGPAMERLRVSSEDTYWVSTFSKTIIKKIIIESHPFYKKNLKQWRGVD